MANQGKVYTGYLTYKDIEFSFVFDGKELRIVPPKDKRDEVNENWLRTPIANGAYSPNTPIIEADYLCGICNETNQKIVFLVRCGGYLTPQGNHLLGGNYVLSTNIIAYILCKYNREKIDRISFTNPEIDAIHPLRTAFSVSLGDGIEEFNKSGVVSVTTKDFSATTTQRQEFVVDDKNVIMYFSVWRGINMGNTEPPLSLNSSLMFEFAPTDDYTFILRLWHIAKDFLSFLCYRQDVYLAEVKLAAPCKDGKHEQFATLYVVDEGESSNVEDIKKGRYIKQEFIAGYEGRILTDIAANKLYLRHIPESYISGCHKDAAKFIMLTSAFEWEFRRTYPNGVKKSDTTLEVEKTVAEAIESLFQNSTGKIRDKYRYLKKRIKDDPLQAEIEQVGTDFEEIIGLFGERLYSINEEKLVYSEMGKRLGDQRNHFAHGDLDKEFIDLSLLDLIFLERIVYALQLKYYGIETIKIQNAINDLFRCGIALPQA